MKVEAIINGLQEIADGHGRYVKRKEEIVEALNFLKAYQGRVKELEDAIEGVVKAQKATGSNSVLMKIEDAAYELKLEREVLTSFYEEGDGSFEEDKSGAVSSLRENTQGMYIHVLR